MPLKKTAMIAAVLIAICGISVVILKMPSEKVLYQEDFGNADTRDSDALRGTDGTLYLDTAEPAHTGGGEWNKNITSQLAKISWQWSGEDIGDFQLWLKFTFSNQKSIYYVAGGSMNPESEGEFYRDDEGRMRYSPSIVISAIPMGTVQRDIRDDYLKYCGSFDDVEIVRINAGMIDESQEHRNKLRISDLIVYT